MKISRGQLGRIIREEARRLDETPAGRNKLNATLQERLRALAILIDDDEMIDTSLIVSVIDDLEAFRDGVFRQDVSKRRRTKRRHNDDGGYEG